MVGCFGKLVLEPASKSANAIPKMVAKTAKTITTRSVMKTEIDEREIQTCHASNSVGALLDIRRRDQRNLEAHTPEDLQLAWDAFAQINQVYIGLQLERNLYMNYRDSLVSIKLTRTTPRSQALLDKMEKSFAKQGIVKVHTNLGTIYQIPYAKKRKA